MAVVVVLSLIVILDRVTKLWALETLSGRGPIPVIDGFFNLVLVRNPGAAFGIFPRQAGIFIALSLLIIAGVLIYYRRTASPGLTLRIAVGLVVGGAVGNLIDRILYSSVVDFLDFYLGAGHWPAFNVADSAICVGVGLIVLLSLRRKEPADAPDPV